jgi:hypothetical protein
MQNVKAALGCPSRTAINAIGSIKNHTYSQEVIDHVSSCSKCRPENHAEECLPYASIRYGINLMPAKLTAAQASAIEKCPSCWLLLTDAGRTVMTNLYGTSHRQ